MVYYSVTTLNDSGDDLYVSTDLAAEIADGYGLSLREALYLANTYGSGYVPTIQFAGALSGSLLLSQQLDVNDTVRILGSENGLSITLDAQGNSRVFGVYSGELTLQGMNITGGDSGGSNGGAIYVGSGASLSLSNSSVFGNTAGSGNGGGIYANGALTLENATLANNTANNGGAIYSTYGQTQITNSTITSNSATGTGGGVYESSLTLTNSIVLGNSDSSGASDINGSVSQYGYNITASYSGTIYSTASQVFASTQTTNGVDGGVIADNAGEVQTVALYAGYPSPAVDAAESNYAPSTDARGLSRDSQPDIGAFEVLNTETPSLKVDTALDVVNAYDGVTSLREAIQHVVDGTLSGTITFANGTGEVFEGPGQYTIRLASTLEIDGGTDSGASPTIVIDSDPTGEGRPLIIISGDVAGNDATTTDSDGNTITDALNNTNTNDNVEVFNLLNYANVTLNGLVITGGVSSVPVPPGGGYGYGGGGYGYGGGGYGYGGGGYGYGGGGYADPTANFRSGGIVASVDSTLTIQNSSISGNASETFAGGLTMQGGTLVLSDSTVESNAGNFGGGLNILGSADIDRVLIANNTGVVGGGLVASSYVDITDVEIRNNASTDPYGYGKGGGVYVTNGAALTGDRVTIAENTSTNFGGGIYSYGTVTVSNLTLAGNSAGTHGGGVYTKGSYNTTLNNATITSNYAGTSGGGVFTNSYYGSATSVSNSLVVGNAAGSDAEFGGSNNSNTTSIVGGDASLIFAQTATSNGVVGGVLGQNDGDIRTVALLNAPGNAAIDAGDDATATTVDARGVARTSDYPGTENNGANLSDLGAFEIGPIETPSLIVTTASDIFDPTDNETSLREAIGHVNAGTLTGQITFQSGLAGSTLYLAGSALSITGNVSIDGDADGDGLRDITVDGNDTQQVFQLTGGTSTLSNLSIQNGNGTYGGAISIAGAGTDVTLDGVEVSSSLGTSTGGGIYQGTGTSLSINNSGIIGNTAVLGGGGLYSQGDLSVTNSLIQSNDTTGGSGGGGVLMLGTSSFTNTTFAGNSSVGAFVLGGAAINFGTLTLTNSTLSGNTAVSAGGLYQGGTATLTNSIILGNTASTDPDIQGYGATTRAEGNIIGTNVYSGANIVGTTSAAQVFESVDGSGAGVAADNGGLFETIALNADVANPAVDAGTAPTGISTDANGNPRDVDLPGVNNGGTVDLGAVEVQAVQETPSLVVTIATDTSDAFDGETSLREAIGHLNDGTLTGTITFASGVGETFENGGTITLGGTQLTLTSDIVIDGDVDGDGSGDITVDGGGASRVFNAFSGTSVLQALTVTGGGNSTFGGGGYVATGATLTLDRTTFEGNTALTGAGLFNNGGTLTLLDSLITDNATTGGNGGGVFSTSNGTTTLTNTTLEGNSAANGGALFGSSSTVELVNVTATGNSASNQGGATFTSGGSLGLTNTLVIGNSQTTGSSVSATNTALDIDNSLLVGNAADIFNAVDLTTGGGALADNGGPVQTVALLVDPANAAAEAGDATLLDEATVGFDLNGDGDLLDTIVTDADGNTRVVGAVDLGATEIQLTLGSVGGDTLTGSGNADTFVTGTGIDVVIAGDGDDSVNAGADDDAVAGGAGNDTINAGSGDDLAVGGPGNDLIYGGDDDDQILPGPGADSVFGGPGEDTVSYVDSAGPVTLDLSDNSNNGGDAAGDQISGIENIIGSASASNTLTGDSADNTIDGGAADDTLNGGGGNDRLEGNGGTDTLDGGLGDDTFVVDSADDVVVEDPGEGFDRVLSTASITLGDNVEAGNLLGSDDLNMTAASTGSWIQGNAGNNTLTGQDANDRLDGNAGDDVLDGAGGNDILEGGTGSDTFVLSDGVDVILDFEDGIDQIDLTGFGLLFSDLTATQSGANVNLGHGTGTLVINNINLADLSSDDFIESAASAPPVVAGTGGNDSLFQPAGPVEIQGLAGNDVMGAFTGAATLVGGTGNDQFYVYDANTNIVELAGEGTDLARSQVDLVLAANVENGAVLGTGDVDLTGNALNNFLTGSVGSNELTGGAGNDRLFGLAGSDTLEGGTGNDILEGGAADGAADRFVFNIGDGSDVVRDFELGIDVIDLTSTALGFSDLSISGTTNALINTGSDLITVEGVSAAQLTSDQFDFAP